MNDQRPDVAPLFTSLFHRRPQWLAAAPGRVNIIGEHVDYCAGIVLPMAIDRATSIAAATRDPGSGPPTARIHAVLKNETVEIPLVARGEPRPGGWAAYAAGVLAGFRERGVEVPAFDAVVDSTVPLGGGLSSSASLEVALAVVVAALAEHPIPTLDLTLLCQRAEHEFAGVPCGIMDQAAVALAEADHLLLLDCRSLEIEHVPFAAADLCVVIADSTVRHSLGDGDYARRRADCDRAAELLGVAALRDAGLDQVEAGRRRLGETGFRRARHVVTEIVRTRAAAAAIAAGRWGEVGTLMAGSHASLRDDFEVSCRELDLLVELAVAQPGVIGSRMTGGGFGGCTVSIVETACVPEVTAAVARGYERATGRRCPMFSSRPAGGAAAWRAT